MDREGILGRWLGYVNFTPVMSMWLNRSLIPKTSAHFNRLLKTLLSPRATASKANNAEYCYGDC